MQHSQPHILLSYAEILLSWSGKMSHGVKSIIMILFSSSLASWIPTSSGGLTMLLSTHEGITDNIPVSLSMSVTVNSSSARKYVLQFPEVLNVKQKTDVHRLDAAK